MAIISHRIADSFAIRQTWYLSLSSCRLINIDGRDCDLCDSVARGLFFSFFLWKYKIATKEKYGVKFANFFHLENGFSLSLARARYRSQQLVFGDAAVSRLRIASSNVISRWSLLVLRGFNMKPFVVYAASRRWHRISSADDGRDVYAVRRIFYVTYVSSTVLLAS